MDVSLYGLDSALYFTPNGRLFTLPYWLARSYLMYAAGFARRGRISLLFGQCLCVTKNRRIVTRCVFYLEFDETTSRNTKVNFNNSVIKSKLLLYVYVRKNTLVLW